MRRRRLLVVALVCAAALALLWFTSRGSGHDVAPLEAIAVDAGGDPDARSVQDLRAANRPALGGADDGDAVDAGERVDAAAEARAARRPKRHPNPPWAKIRARLVVAGEPGPYATVPLRYENRGRHWRMGNTTALGELEQRLSKPGSFRFYINRTTLPEDYVVARSEHRGVFGSFPSWTEEVQLRAGQRFEAELYVFEARRLTGVVVDATGAPVEGARLLLDELTEGVRERAEARTSDRYGRFEFLRLLPTEYELRLQSPRGPSGVGLGAPAPLAYDLTQGSFESQRIAFASGGIEVRGRVVDETGQPLSGLYVYARYVEPAAEAPEASAGSQATGVDPRGATERPRSGFSGKAAGRVETDTTKQRPVVSGGSRVVTDVNGEYRFLGLQPREMRLEFGSKGPAAGGRSKPVARSIRVPIDLRSVEGGQYEVDPQVLVRRRDFELSGRVELTAKHHEGRRLRLRRVQVTGRYGLEDEGVSQLDGDRIEYDRETGEFTIHGNAEIELLEVRVSVWPAKDHVRSYTFPVVPFGVQRDVVLEYP